MNFFSTYSFFAELKEEPLLLYSPSGTAVCILRVESPKVPLSYQFNKEDPILSPLRIELKKRTEIFIWGDQAEDTAKNLSCNSTVLIFAEKRTIEELEPYYLAYKIFRLTKFIRGQKNLKNNDALSTSKQVNC